MARVAIVRTEGGWASQLSCLAFGLSQAPEGFEIEHHTGGGASRRPFELLAMVPDAPVRTIDDWRWSAGRPRIAGAVHHLERMQERIRRAAGTTVLRLGTLQGDIVQQVPVLSQRIRNGGLPDFTQVGDEDAISVHVRLGDYRTHGPASAFHGVISPASLADAIRGVDIAQDPDARPLPIRIFSEEPEVAIESLIEAGIPRNRLDASQCKPNDIWSDSFAMTRSRVFIGSNSGISLWAAIAHAASGKTQDHQVLLPRPWFRRASAEYVNEQGVPPATQLPNLQFYDARFT